MEVVVPSCVTSVVSYLQKETKSLSMSGKQSIKEL